VLTIREFKPDDIEACAVIYLEARRRAFHWINADQFHIDDFGAHTNDEMIWVAEIGKMISGFISVYTPEDYIHHLFVHPDHQGQGNGSALLHFALDRVGRPVDLKCLIANERGCAFYVNHGWHEVERGDDVFGEYIRYRKYQE
jgi:GNAT superfamily N-acetyltransferase